MDDETELIKIKLYIKESKIQHISFMVIIKNFKSIHLFSSSGTRVFIRRWSIWLKWSKLTFRIWVSISFFWLFDSIQIELSSFISSSKLLSNPMLLVSSSVCKLFRTRLLLSLLWFLLLSVRNLNDWWITRVSVNSPSKMSYLWVDIFFSKIWYNFHERLFNRCFDLLYIVFFQIVDNFNDVQTNKTRHLI